MGCDTGFPCVSGKWDKEEIQKERATSMAQELSTVYLRTVAAERDVAAVSEASWAAGALERHGTPTHLRAPCLVCWLLHHGTFLNRCEVPSVVTRLKQKGQVSKGGRADG